MIGPEKLSSIRAQVRKSFRKSDVELFAWFNQQIEDAGQKPKKNETAIDTLRLLRDAFVKEAKRPAPRRAAGGSKK